MARAGCGGDLAKAAISEAVTTELLDNCDDKVLPAHRPECTMWYMSKVIHVVVPSEGAPATVFRLLAQTERWPEWSPMSAAVLEQAAPGEDPEGVGAIRRFTTGRSTSRERVVAYEPGRQLSYELLSGLPLRNYRADVTMEPKGGGTLITWHSEFEPARPGTGWLYRALLAKFIKRTARQLAAAAERASAGSGLRTQ